MPAPSVSYVDIPTDYIDGRSPVNAELVKTFRDNEEWCKQVLYGTGSFVGATPHVHTGTEDALVDTRTGDNTLNDPVPDNDTAAWTLNAVTLKGVDGTFKFPGASGGYMWQRVCQKLANRAFFGTNGADMVVSMLFRLEGPCSAGVCYFGLADNSTSTFIAGCRGTINDEDASVGWRRFWFPVSNKGGSTTDFRFLVYTQTSFTTAFHVTAPDVYVGSILRPFRFGPVERKIHDSYKGVGTRVPAWSEYVTMTNAIRVTPA